MAFNFKATPMLVPLHRFKAFLLYYHSKTCWVRVTLVRVMHWAWMDLMEYCSLKAYNDDYAAACPATPLKSLKRYGSYDSIRETINVSGSSSVIDNRPCENT
jgi:hypothetical protein